MSALLFVTIFGLVRGALVLKIVNSNDACIEDYSYMVSIEHGGHHYCGGSIVGKNRILTAAQCTDSYTTSQLTIRAGSTIREQGGQVKTVAQKIQHPKYNPETLENDIAVLVLTGHLELNNKVRIVPLATEGNIPDDYYVTVTGWGITQNRTLATVLQKLVIGKVNPEYCLADYGSQFKPNLMGCFGNILGKSLCDGDFGGPVVCEGIQVGVASFGPSDCLGLTPAVYARVEAYQEFIKDNLK